MHMRVCVQWTGHSMLTVGLGAAGVVALLRRGVELQGILWESHAICPILLSACVPRPRSVEACCCCMGPSKHLDGTLRPTQKHPEAMGLRNEYVGYSL